MDIAERNQKIKLRKQNKRLGIVQQKILLLLLGGLALSCARTASRQWKILKAIRGGWGEIQKQAAERAIESLYESRLIEARENSDRTTTLMLSRQGKKRALTYKTFAMRVANTKPWDGKWRIVLYDIPEDEREARNAFRDHLTDLGFRKLQHSAGIYPLECHEEIEFLVELHDIRRYVRYIIAEHIDNEIYWRNVFRLD